MPSKATASPALISEVYFTALPPKKKDRSGYQPHHKSRYRDADFMRRAIELASNAKISEPLRSILCIEASKTTARRDAQGINNREESRRTGKPARNTRSHKRWYDVELPPSRGHRRAAPWRDASLELRAQFAHFALVGGGGGAHAMTVNLSRNVEALALAGSSGAKRYLSRRLSHYLDQALGRSVQFWFELDVSDRPASRLHLHGGIACNANEVRGVKAALRRAGGEWAKNAMKHQVALSPDPDDGFVSYAFKDQILYEQRFLAKFNGRSWCSDPLMITRRLKSDAKALYEGVRRDIALSGRSIRMLEKAELDFAGLPRSLSLSENKAGRRMGITSGAQSFVAGLLGWATTWRSRRQVAH